MESAPSQRSRHRLPRSSSRQSRTKPSTVPLIYVKKVEPNSIEVAWRPPSDHFSEIEMYEVQYFVRGSTQSSSPKTQITKNEELVVTGLAEKTEYGFQVRAKRVSGGWGDFTPAPPT